MLRKWILYALLLLASVLLAAYFESFLTGLLLVLTVALPVLGLLLSLPAMLELRVRLSPAAPRVRRGGACSWKFETGSRHGFSVARTELRLDFQNRMTGSGSRRRLCLLGTPAGSFLTIPAETEHCGLLEARVTRARVFDCLGLFWLPKKLPPRAVLPVLPQPVEPEELPEERGGPGQLTPRPGGGPGEDYEIRPYRPGDPVRMIHWKLTCKRDEPILREVLEAKRAEPLLTFDHFGPPETVDRILDRVNALSEALVSARRPHTLRWLEQGSGALRSFHVESKREYERFLSAILDSPAPLTGTPTPRGGGGNCYHIGAEDEA